MLRVSLNGGFHLPDIDIHFDSTRPLDICYVSHAHKDHYGRHRQFVSTTATWSLSHLRRAQIARDSQLDFGTSFGSSSFSTHFPFEFDRTLQFSDYSITALPAGHILGATQFYVESSKGTLLYTGDLNTSPGFTTYQATSRKADILIIDSTYGDPKIIFPSIEERHLRIYQFCKESLESGLTPALMCWSVGRAQEALCLLDRGGFSVCAAPRIDQTCKIYRDLGVTLPSYRLFPEIEAKDVLLFPARGLFWQIPKWRDRFSWAYLSGWSAPEFILPPDCKQLILSDHCDYPALCKFIEDVQPKKVIAFAGYANAFSADLRKRGVDAISAVCLNKP